jgi:hypothetical protein
MSSCAYDGSICSCTAFCPSYPIAMPDCDADMGLTKSCCDTSKVEWHCFDGPAYCATPRPRVGTPCAKGQASCAVSPPVECGQAVLECQDGVWNLANTACPI